MFLRFAFGDKATVTYGLIDRKCTLARPGFYMLLPDNKSDHMQQGPMALHNV